jgi:hypothetical protein
MTPQFTASTALASVPAQIPGGSEVVGPVAVVLLILAVYVAYRLYVGFRDTPDP